MPKIANGLQTITISLLLLTLTATVFIGLIGEVSDNYGVIGDTNEIAFLEQSKQIRGNITESQNQLINESSVSTVESEASFFTAAYTTGKTAFNSVGIGVSLIQFGGSFIPFPAVVASTLVGILIVVGVFALIRLITGRE